jgi:hypothetical protein
MSRIDRIRERLDGLGEKVLPLADLVRQHSDRAHAALATYPEKKVRAVGCLREASVHQARAMEAARRLAVYQVALDDLLGQIQRVEQLGTDPAALAGLKCDYGRLERTIARWSSPPAGEDKTALAGSKITCDQLITSDFRSESRNGAGEVEEPQNEGE